MSALIGHAKAARILGGVISDTARDMDLRPLIGEQNALLLMTLGQSLITAAGEMERAMRAECSGVERL